MNTYYEGYYENTQWKSAAEQAHSRRGAQAFTRCKLSSQQAVCLAGAMASCGRDALQLQAIQVATGARPGADLEGARVRSTHSAEVWDATQQVVSSEPQGLHSVASGASAGGEWGWGWWGGNTSAPSKRGRTPAPIRSAWGEGCRELSDPLYDPTNSQ